MLYRVTIKFPCLKKLFILVEFKSFIGLNWVLSPGLKRLTKEKTKYGAIIPLSFNSSESFSFIFSIALLFLIKVSVLVFVKF